MRYFAHVALASVALGAAASGCTCDDPAPRPQPPAATSAVSAAASASAAPARTPRPTQSAPKPSTFEVTTSDEVIIEASRWSGGDPSAPAVILVHRLGGTRAEWTPLVERLFPPKHPMNVVALDLRGHGASKSSKKQPKTSKETIRWQHFDKPQFESMVEDLSALSDHMRKQKGGPPSQWVFVGSDIGGTVAVRHAAKQEDVAGVALVSPGASLRGLDVYDSFGALLQRPNLIIAAKQDNVSHEPARTLAAMSKTSRLVTFDAREHAAEFLGEKRWEMWDELADWVEARVSAKPAPAGSSADAPASASPAASASAGR
ncbi:MAG: alpha/beta hydrolase [Myxococcota bacterium]